MFRLLGGYAYLVLQLEYGKIGTRFPARMGGFSFAQTSRPAMWTIRSHMQRVPRPLTSGVNRQRCESEHTFLNSVKVRIPWGYTSPHLTTQYDPVAWYVIKHKGIFNLGCKLSSLQGLCPSQIILPNEKWPPLFRYGMVSPGIKSRWGRDFPHTSIPAMRPMKPPKQWVSGVFSGVNAIRAWRSPPTLTHMLKKEYRCNTIPPSPAGFYDLL
jgi:hypothetical protein